ncbi:MAG TPA: serine--tRNA ligase, partial [Anaeromyxobacter sp.]
MLDLRAVAQDYESFERRLARRGEAAVQALAPVRPLAARRRELNVQIERQKKEQNEANAKMREVAKTDKGAVEGARAQLRALGDEVKKSEQELAQVEAEIERLLLLVP